MVIDRADISVTLAIRESHLSRPAVVGTEQARRQSTRASPRGSLDQVQVCVCVCVCMCMCVCVCAQSSELSTNEVFFLHSGVISPLVLLKGPVNVVW